MTELVYAHILFVDGRPDQGLAILKPCEDSARSFGAGGWLIQNLALQALCYQATNDLERALKILHEALTIAEPEGFIRTFIDHGPPMKQLLGQITKMGIYPGYTHKLLACFPESIIPASLTEPLTDQEMRVLRLMAAGLSHHEIASELYLSINTIKWHTTHIYGKLGVHRRAHAVTRAKELGIL